MRVKTCSGAIGAMVLLAPAFSVAGATAEGGTTVVLDSKLRRCDFSLVSTAAWVPSPPLATGFAVIRRSGSTVSADVHLSNEPQPFVQHFDVGLIQEPRSAAATCGPGDPGTAFRGMDTDGSGNGTVTVQDTIQPGTTGVWVIVERPNAHSQNPAEFYTSEFLAPV